MSMDNVTLVDLCNNFNDYVENLGREGCLYVHLRQLKSCIQMQYHAQCRDIQGPQWRTKECAIDLYF